MLQKGAEAAPKRKVPRAHALTKRRKRGVRCLSCSLQPNLCCADAVLDVCCRSSVPRLVRCSTLSDAQPTKCALQHEANPQQAEIDRLSLACTSNGRLSMVQVGRQLLFVVAAVVGQTLCSYQHCGQKPWRSSSSCASATCIEQVKDCLKAARAAKPYTVVSDGSSGGDGGGRIGGNADKQALQDQQQQRAKDKIELVLQGVEGGSDSVTRRLRERTVRVRGFRVCLDCWPAR